MRTIHWKWFDCGKPELNDWLVRHARQAQAVGSAKSYVVVEGDRIAGYFSLTVGQIDTLDAPERFRKGMGSYPVPVVMLARLAVCLIDQRRGIGLGMLKMPFSARWPSLNRLACGPC